jgi:hypothetical protein
VNARTGVMIASLTACALAAPARAQQRNLVCAGFHPNVNINYDGRFSFVRVEYTAGLGGSSFGYGRGRMAGGWWHDYPTAECHFNKLLTNLTTVRARQDGSLILAFDDPELFKFPIAYLSEPGAWHLTDPEVLGLRNYLLKGGFLMLDDFDAQDVPNVNRQMTRVLPGMRIIRLDQKHPIFDAFYRVKSLEFFHPMSRIPSSFYAIFEDNDPRKRMLVILNVDNDIGDYWEWSDTGMYGIDPSNEAYKLGINYIIHVLAR